MSQHPNVPNGLVWMNVNSNRHDNPQVIKIQERIPYPHNTLLRPMVNSSRYWGCLIPQQRRILVVTTVVLWYLTVNEGRMQVKSWEPEHTTRRWQRNRINEFVTYMKNPNTGIRHSCYLMYQEYHRTLLLSFSCRVSSTSVLRWTIDSAMQVCTYNICPYCSLT